MSLDSVTDAVFPGPAPYAIPLLAEYVGLMIPEGKDWALAEFRFEDGAPVHVPISIQAADYLADSIAVWKLKRAGKDAKTSPKH